MRITASNYRLVPAYNILQDQHRFVCGQNCDEYLRVYDTAYPPFQLVFREDMGTVTAVTLERICGGGPMQSSYLSTSVKAVKDIDQDGEDEYIYTFEGGPVGGNAPGTYYVKVVFSGGEEVYLETFANPGTTETGGCVDCKEYWYLEYSHSCDEKSLGDYSMGFLNKLFLGDILLIPDGAIENIVSREDGFGVETKVASDIRPKWAFEIVGNWWLHDSLNYLKLYDQVYLKRSGNTDIFRLYNIEVVPKGDVEACLFALKVSFTKDILTNTKCCDSVYEQAPVPGNCAGMSAMTSDDFTICLGDEAELTATVIGGAAPYVYIWSNGEIGDTITVSPTETTSYTVTVVDAFGCAKQASVTITVIDCEGEMILIITPDPSTFICQGNSVDLDLEVTEGSGDYSYLWSTGATTQDISPTPTATTTYSVVVTDNISGNIQSTQITIYVIQTNSFQIQSNGCSMTIVILEQCPGMGEIPMVFEWQIETDPDVWVAAPGDNDGISYVGVHGSTYRLSATCAGCTRYSEPLTLDCPTPCTTEITEITYDSENEELIVTYATVLGSTPFSTGYIVINETNTPNLGNCAASGGWMFVINVTLTAASDTINIPFTPITLPTCVVGHININAGECTDAHYAAIS